MKTDTVLTTPKKKFRKRDRIVNFFISLIIIVAMLGMEFLIDLQGNIRTADSTIGLLLEEIENVFDGSNSEETLLVASLKEDYVTRARAVSYTVEHDEELSGNFVELKKLATLMNVDEINLFDSTGTIIGGTNREYYGVSMEDGDQIGYFRPMLKNRKLTMCQDVTPNTAEGRYMMYAMVWREDGSGMVQVGIEPERLIEEMNENSISELIDSMPMVEGITIDIADKQFLTVVGSTDSGDIGCSLADLGVPDGDYNWTKPMTMKSNGVRCRAICSEYGDYIIGVRYDYDEINKGLILNLVIVLTYLVLLILLIQGILSKLRKNREQARAAIEKSQAEKEAQFNVLRSMSDMYTSMHLMNLADGSWQEYSATKDVRNAYYKTDDLPALMANIISANTSVEFREEMLEFTDLHTVAERMRGVKSIYHDFIGIYGKWSRASFIMIDKDDDGCPVSLIFAVQLVDEEKRREERLKYKSNTDELTKCANRRSYEEDTAKMKEEGIPDDLVIVSMDVNGLKVVNDNLGHAAGDELIRGAVDCIRSAMGAYGKVYRTGGDEFMALIHAEKDRAGELAERLKECAAGWKGHLVNELSISVGYTVCRDNPGMAFEDLEKASDDKMYSDKSAYYSRKGIDRRGQAAAYNAICDSYTKILKADLTADTFSIIKLAEKEMSPDTGFSRKLSEWLKGFAAAGFVHEEDLAEYSKYTDLEYIRGIFAGGGNRLTIHYRRLTEGEYRKVMMELVPADDYCEETRNVYLYVKELD